MPHQQLSKAAPPASNAENSMRDPSYLLAVRTAGHLFPAAGAKAASLGVIPASACGLSPRSLHGLAALILLPLLVCGLSNSVWSQP